MTPRAIFHLRFHKAFPLEAAIPLVDYLAELGISHVCASPLLRSRPGPRHGYNVVDVRAIDPDLGGEQALSRLSAALRRRQMGLILEIAPGHMGVGGADNAAWLDLLEWGRDAVHAPWFDVSWRAGASHLRNKVFVPFLDRPYWEAMESGALQFAFEEARGCFVVRHYEHAFPICPAHYAAVLDASDAPALGSMRQVFRALPTLRPDPDEVRAAKFRLAAFAATVDGRAAIGTVLSAFDAADADGRARLHNLLTQQNYHLAWWRTANDDINWRRYLDASGLAGLRLERADVFEQVHEYVLKLYADGVVDGLRVAHLDLMADPAAYAQRLKLKLADLTSRRPADAPAVGLIGLPATLAAPRGKKADEPFDENRRKACMVEAAMEAIGQVMHDPAAAPLLTDTWSLLSGDSPRYEELRTAARAEVLAERFGAELKATAAAFYDVALGVPEGHDVTFAAIERVLGALAIAFPVCRAYGDMDGHSAEDAALYAEAFEGARAFLRPIDQPVADLLALWLGGEPPRAVADFAQGGARAQAIARFQQLTASLSRTAQDGTVLHRYARLLSRNESGSDPSALGLRPAAFHALMTERRAHCPDGLSATSGPNAKRGEDGRMRLAAVSEAPREWDSLLRRLMEHMAGFRGGSETDPAPAPADEILLYQGLIAAWPLSLRLDDARQLADLKERVSRWFLEATRHSGRRTHWLFGDEAYERACARFVEALLLDPVAQPARQILAEFVERLSLAGAINGYGQAVLKCTVPGIPSLYQGTDYWDFALGAPDNRRAVDFGVRETSLTGAPTPDQLLQTWHDGRAKQALLARLLHLRAAAPLLFAQGSYEPLAVEGMREASGLAFVRRHGGKAVIVVVTRLALGLLGPGPMPPRVPTVRWGDTGFALPEDLPGPFRDVITGREVEANHGRLELGDVLAAFPAAVLLAR